MAIGSHTQISGVLSQIMARLVTRMEAGQILGISPDAISHLAKKDKRFPESHHIGGMIFFETSRVERYKQKHFTKRVPYDDVYREAAKQIITMHSNGEAFPSIAIKLQMPLGRVTYLYQKTSYRMRRDERRRQAVDTISRGV